MSEQRKPITHPTWCDLEACTAPEFRMTNEEYQQTRTHDAPRHKSRVLVMDKHRQDAGLFVFLEQLCAPWECSTFLRFQVGKGAFAETFSTEVGDAGPAQGFALFELLAEEVASQTRQYPSLYGERFGWVADAVKPQDAETPAQDVVVPGALQDAPAPDPATRVTAMDAPCDCGAAEDPDGETMCTCTAQRAAAAAEDAQEAAELAGWDSLPGVTDTYPSTAISDNAEHVEDQEDGGDRWYLLHLDNSVILQGPFVEIRARVAERVTELLATDPENLAMDAQMLNLAFTGGDVEKGVALHGEWSTLFGAASKTPVRIRVTRES